MTKTKKPIFILMFAVLSAIMLVGAKFTSAKAAEKLIIPSDAKIELTDGVSIKLNDDGGMRFVAKMNEAAKNYVCDNEAVSLVALIAPDYIIGNGEDFATLKDTCIKIVANKAAIYEVDGSYYANFCVIKMKTSNINLDYTAAVYILNGETVAAKTGVNVKSVNNFYNITNQAFLYNGGKNYSADILALDSYDWFGRKEYPVTVNSSADYNNLVKAINGGAEISEKHVEIAASVDTTAGELLDDGKTMPENTKSVAIVSFVNGGETISSEKIEKGKTVSEPAASEIGADDYAIKNGAYYKFDGWYNGDEKYEFTSPVTTNITLEARWIEIGAINNATVKISGDYSLNKITSGAAYTDSSYIELGDFRNGGYVAVDFTGKVAPQIAFFLSGATSSMKDDALGCMLFTSDVATADYRMFPHTDPNTGAVLAGKWNKGAFNNLEPTKNYVLLIGCVKNNLNYNVSFALYEKDGLSISRVDGGEYSCSYAVDHKDLKNSGEKIVLFGSRHANANGKFAVAATENEVLAGYDRIKTYKATYSKESGEVKFNTCAGSTSYTDCSYIDFGEYENGGEVTVEFKGKYKPQIGFFLSGGTATMKADALGGLIFSDDAVGSDYRMWKCTDVTTGAVLFSKWNVAAYNNLDASASYKLQIKCVKAQRYEIYMALYTLNGETYELMSEYSENYALNYTSISNSGTHIVLFGSRITALTAKVSIVGC